MNSPQWLPILGWPGYEVSESGLIRSLPRTAIRSDGRRSPVTGRVLKLQLNRKGYPIVCLHGSGGRKTIAVHRLVAAAFLGPKPEGLDIRHLDGNPQNNSAVNLAYGTRSQNSFDSVRHGTHARARQTHCAQGHPFAGDNLILERGRRFCRECRGDSHRRLAEKRHAA